MLWFIPPAWEVLGFKQLFLTWLCKIEALCIVNIVLFQLFDGYTASELRVADYIRVKVQEQLCILRLVCRRF